MIFECKGVYHTAVFERGALDVICISFPVKLFEYVLCYRMEGRHTKTNGMEKKIF